jgi:hypothetical protein
MIPPVDITHIAEELDRFEDELIAAHEDRGGAEDTNPRPLLGATRELLDELGRQHPEYRNDPLAGGDAAESGRSLTALGDHGIDLLARLAALAGRLQHPRLTRGVETLTLPLACWIARCGGEINNLGPVVNGAAAVANGLKQPAELARLYGLLREVGLAVNPAISQETSAADPTRPWRVFLLNRAIVATRSHQPTLMEEAFDLIAEHLPHEAPDFFREGMEQMDALEYPSHVREVVERYYDHWCRQRILH